MTSQQQFFDPSRLLPLHSTSYLCSEWSHRGYCCDLVNRPQTTVATTDSISILASTESDHLFPKHLFVNLSIKLPIDKRREITASPQHQTWLPTR